jgi:hypothetical protein
MTGYVQAKKKNLDGLFRFNPCDKKLPPLPLSQNAKVKQFMELNSSDCIYEGDLETRYGFLVKHAKIWIELWEKNDLSTLTSFSLLLAQRKGQCVGVLNLLVWASILGTPRQFVQGVLPHLNLEDEHEAQIKAEDYLLHFLCSEVGAQPWSFSFMEMGLYDVQGTQSTFTSSVLEYARQVSLANTRPLVQYLKECFASRTFATTRHEFLTMVRKLESQLS